MSVIESGFNGIRGGDAASASAANQKGELMTFSVASLFLPIRPRLNSFSADRNLQLSVKGRVSCCKLELFLQTPSGPSWLCMLRPSIYRPGWESNVVSRPPTYLDKVAHFALVQIKGHQLMCSSSQATM